MGPIRQGSPGMNGTAMCASVPREQKKASEKNQSERQKGLERVRMGARECAELGNAGRWRSRMQWARLAADANGKREWHWCRNGDDQGNGGRVGRD